MLFVLVSVTSLIAEKKSAIKTIDSLLQESRDARKAAYESEKGRFAWLNKAKPTEERKKFIIALSAYYKALDDNAVALAKDWVEQVKDTDNYGNQSDDTMFSNGTENINIVVAMHALQQANLNSQEIVSENQQEISRQKKLVDVQLYANPHVQQYMQEQVEINHPRKPQLNYNLFEASVQNSYFASFKRYTGELEAQVMFNMSNPKIYQKYSLEKLAAAIVFNVLDVEGDTERLAKELEDLSTTNISHFKKDSPEYKTIESRYKNNEVYLVQLYEYLYALREELVRLTRQAQSMQLFSIKSAEGNKFISSPDLEGRLMYGSQKINMVLGNIKALAVAQTQIEAAHGFISGTTKK